LRRPDLPLSQHSAPIANEKQIGKVLRMPFSITDRTAERRRSFQRAAEKAARRDEAIVSRVVTVMPECFFQCQNAFFGFTFHSN
jgi:hypothetical protein